MYTDTQSAQPCGCDEGAGWVCEWHGRDMATTEVGPIQSSADLGIFQPKPATLTGAPGVKFTLTGLGGAPLRTSVLPKGPAERKQYPLASGLFDYFPDALAVVANVSWQGNEQHNPGKPLHWDRSKSADEDDTLLRHFAERGTRDSDGIRHTAKMAWRALALLQKELEGEQA